MSTDTRKRAGSTARTALTLLSVALTLTLLVTPGSARAAGENAEKILSFSSLITVNPDASMTVSETIRVRVTGEQIKRGIFRDFPTTYTDPAGNRYVVGFAVASVTRDGKPEAHHTEKRTNGIRVYMGRKDHRVPPGEHSYTLTYTTDRQLGFFKRHDELYWNVTGNGWDFQIDTVEAAVVPPPGVPSGSLTLEAYTGPSGAKRRDYRAAAAPDGGAVFRTTRPLAPREGLTIVVGWPKGFVAEPYVFGGHGGRPLRTPVPGRAHPGAVRRVPALRRRPGGRAAVDGAVYRLTLPRIRGRRRRLPAPLVLGLLGQLPDRQFRGIGRKLPERCDFLIGKRPGLELRGRRRLLGRRRQGRRLVASAPTPLLCRGFLNRKQFLCFS